MTRLKPDSIAYPPRGLSREAAARYIGVGTTTFDRLIAEGRMPKPLRVGKRTIWDRLKLDAAFTELGEEPVENRLDRALRMARSSRSAPSTRGAASEQEDWAEIARERGAFLDRGVDPDTGAQLRRGNRGGAGKRSGGGHGKD